MSILAKVRKDMMASGHSEAEAFSQGGLVAIFDDLQNLRRERNTAKREALIQLDKDYNEAEVSLERRYAMMMKLSARNSDK